MQSPGLVCFIPATRKATALLSPCIVTRSWVCVSTHQKADWSIGPRHGEVKTLLKIPSHVITSHFLRFPRTASCRDEPILAVEANKSNRTSVRTKGVSNLLHNLKAEMTRRNIGPSDIGRVINKSNRTASDKVAGRYPFTINEAKTIRDAFFQGMDLEFLFADCPDQ